MYKNVKTVRCRNADGENLGYIAQIGGEKIATIVYGLNGFITIVHESCEAFETKRMIDAKVKLADMFSSQIDNLCSVK